MKTPNNTIRLVIGSALVFMSLSLIIASAYASSGEEEEKAVRIRARDDCEPVSFNAAVGPGSCNTAFPGRTTFSNFIAQLQQNQRARLWRFSPARIEVEPGTTLVIVSRGGETHTITQVAAFGGGFIIPLNALSGNPTPRTECTTGATVVPNVVLESQPPGPSAANPNINIFVPSFLSANPSSVPTNTITIPKGTPSGTVIHFECCIHPWMHLTVTVED